RRNAHELPAVDQVRDRVGADDAAQVLAPDFLARVRVERKEVTFVAAAEHDLAAGRKNTCPRFGMQLVIPDSLAGVWIECPNRAVARVLRQIDQRNAADVAIARAVFLLAFAIHAAILPDGKIEEFG